MGSKGAPPPDYAPLAEASTEAARIQAGLGREQLAFAREQYDRSAPILEQIANQQMAAQDEQMSQARDYYNYQKDTYRPLERGLVADAQRFNTDAYRNDLASKAAADTGVAFGQNQAMKLWQLWGLTPTQVALPGCSKPVVWRKQLLGPMP